MPKAARIISSISAPRTYTDRSATKSKESQSDAGQLAAVALFACIGLLVSLVAVLLGMQGVWL